jgi:hypothetical protein
MLEKQMWDVVWAFLPSASLFSFRLVAMVVLHLFQ